MSNHDRVLRTVGERVYHWHVEAAFAVVNRLIVGTTNDRMSGAAVEADLSLLRKHLSVLLTGEVPNEGDARHAEVHRADAAARAFDTLYRESPSFHTPSYLCESCEHADGDPPGCDHFGPRTSKATSCGHYAKRGPAPGPFLCETCARARGNPPGCRRSAFAVACDAYKKAKAAPAAGRPEKEP